MLKKLQTQTEKRVLVNNIYRNPCDKTERQHTAQQHNFKHLLHLKLDFKDKNNKFPKSHKKLHTLRLDVKKNRKNNFQIVLTRERTVNEVEKINIFSFHVFFYKKKRHTTFLCVRTTMLMTQWRGISPEKHQIFFLK